MGEGKARSPFGDSITFLSERDERVVSLPGIYKDEHFIKFTSVWRTDSAYLRLLIFLPAILIPACASSSPGFLVMYSA